MKKILKPSINEAGNIEVRMDEHKIEVHGGTGKMISHTPGISAQDLFHMLALAHNYAPERKDG